MASHTAAQCVTRALGLDATLLSDAACMKLAISKVLGLGVVAGSALVKVPQIVKMINASSADGLSGTSITLEAVSNVAAVSYYAGLDFAFSTWGENIFLLLQNLAIAGLYLMYTRRLRSHGPFHLLFYLFFFLALYSRAVPDIPLPPATCQYFGLRPPCSLTCERLAGVLPIVITFFSKVPQVIQNQRQRHTGQLAIITCALNVLGNIARVFTTLQELDDPITLTGAIAALLQNGIILGQVIAYRKTTAQAAKISAAKKQ